MIFLLCLVVPWRMTKLQCIHMKECYVSFRYRYGGMCSFIGRCLIGWVNRAGDYRTWINLTLILGHVWVWLRDTAFQKAQRVLYAGFQEGKGQIIFILYLFPPNFYNKHLKKNENEEENRKMRLWFRLCNPGLNSAPT